MSRIKVSILQYPRSLQTEGVSRIGGYAFYSYGKLNSVVLPDTVRSVGDYAFAGCSSLGNVTVPASVTEIGDHAFEPSETLNIICCEDSAAHSYALSKGLSYTLVLSDPILTVDNYKVSITRGESIKDIRYAPGSRYLTPSDILEDSVTLSLVSGIYTLCVQYDDESYNNYTVAID